MRNNTKKIMISALVFSAISSTSVFARMEDDPIELKLMLDKFEVGRVDSKNIVAWEGGFWLGKDINKLYLKTSGEQAGGQTEVMESQLRTTLMKLSLYGIDHLMYYSDLKTT